MLTPTARAVGWVGSEKAGKVWGVSQTRSLLSSNGGKPKCSLLGWDKHKRFWRSVWLTLTRTSISISKIHLLYEVTVEKRRRRKGTAMAWDSEGGYLHTEIVTCDVGDAAVLSR